MKKFILLFLFVSTISFSQITTTPSPAIATGVVTLNFNKTGTPLAAYAGIIYAHIGLTVDGVQWTGVKGTWGNNTTQPALTFVSGTTYSLTMSPDLYTYFGVPVTSSITQICVVLRNAAGSAQTTDTFLNVGAFQSTLVTPSENTTTIINSGQNLSISASNSNGTADYNLLANGVSINTSTGTSYSYSDNGITSNKNYVLQITQGVTTFSKRFNVIVVPTTVNEALGAGLEDGINYNASDASTATLVLTAPGKDFVYVAGSFNNWVPDTNYAMKKDPTSGKFWLQLTGLVSGATNTYQYWVVDQTPTTNSQSFVKVADPYSTLVLSPYDDSGIPAANYPGLPAYPAGQQYEVTVLQTGQTPYNWSSATTNFVKPSKDNLVVYEVLIRDFDASRTYQSLIDRIDYFKNLKVNAIELMPIMEYEGNESWGYNTAFHMALDKFYGSKAKLQEFVDLCHQNGIAVVLDIALNHAFGRCPMVRMWQNDPTNTGYGAPATDNPYFNTVAKHSYGVGNDFNHSSAYTKYFVKRVIKQWVEEFKIDGFRWDLTKGFTQACSAGNDTCTNAYQADRVAILKEYADYSWSLDPYHYVIFEHLGIDSEEQQWANYRIAETPSKGVMMWGEMTYAYSQLMEGYTTGADISRIGSDAHGFTAKRLMGYPESHDKDRLMYSGITYGLGSGTNPPVGSLNNCLTRMSAVGAISLLVPGPKMIWHFADLGMNSSIYTCTDNSINTEVDATAGDCKLATKPQPQWVNNWLGVPTRAAVYNNWAKMIDLKKSNVVFNGSYAVSPNGNNLLQRVYVYDNSLPAGQLKNVVILANFGTSTANIVPDFPYTGTWYNLMDNTSTTISSASAAISLGAGQFRIYGNQTALGVEDFNPMEFVALAPNPASNYFTINADKASVEIFSITGQLVKTFKEGQLEDYQYNISDLNKGVYLVKATDENNHFKTMKLIKQ
ncbi:MAG: alpha-amylase family glycosyl hydrolase [Flavobacterium sp.]|uniref:alpha-amylase family glycosyl hydrolase n=1 Tax=Flavobacterium sp. TaxID=239 RepID=UPI003266131B